MSESEWSKTLRNAAVTFVTLGIPIATFYLNLVDRAEARHERVMERMDQIDERLRNIETGHAELRGRMQDGQ